MKTERRALDGQRAKAGALPIRAKARAHLQWWNTPSAHRIPV